MECPLRLPVYYDGQEVGQLQVELTGLYYHFRSRCRLHADRVLRLYAVCGFRSVPVGILMPLQEEFVLDERISARSWELERIDAMVCGYCPDAGVMPWIGTVDGVRLDRCWLRTRADGYELLFAEENGAFPLPAALVQTKREQCAGMHCASLYLNPEGNILGRDETEESTPATAAEEPTEEEAIETVERQ